MKFQEGDRVRIRPDLASCDPHEWPCIVPEMLDWAGQEATIQKRSGSIYRMSEFAYIWLDKWLEPIEENEQTEYGKLNLDSVL